MMKTTRRRWLVALSGLIALPVLPRAAPTPAPPSRGIAGLTLRQHLASLHYPAPGEIRHSGHFQNWEAIPRQPVTMDQIESREEFIRCELHGLRVTGGDAGLISRLDVALADCEIARRLIRLQPTGRPLTFRYHGGITPHRERTVLPTLVFQPGEDTHHGTSLATNPLAPLYLQAYCIERLAPRTFRLDRIQNLALLTEAATCRRQA